MFWNKKEAKDTPFEEIGFLPKDLALLMNGVDLGVLIVGIHVLTLLPKLAENRESHEKMLFDRYGKYGIIDENGNYSDELKEALEPFGKPGIAITDGQVRNDQGQGAEKRSVGVYIANGKATGVRRGKKLTSGWNLVPFGDPSTWNEKFMDLFGIKDRFKASQFSGKAVITDNSMLDMFAQAIKEKNEDFIASFAEKYNLSAEGLMQVANADVKRGFFSNDTEQDIYSVVEVKGELAEYKGFKMAYNSPNGEANYNTVTFYPPYGFALNEYLVSRPGFPEDYMEHDEYRVKGSFGKLEFLDDPNVNLLEYFTKIGSHPED